MSRPQISEAGTIVTIFAHRFVLERADGSRLLADLGPRGLEAFPLVEGAEIAIVGEPKPSEIKVSSVTPRDGSPILIPHGDHGGDDAAVEAALAAVKAAGLTPLAPVRRKPKHCEVLVRRDGVLVEIHVATDGTIRKEKVADIEAWADALGRHPSA